MISIEMEGKTPEDAIKKALEVLDAPRERVKVEILNEGSKGLFGMIGSKQAKIRAELLEFDESEPRPAATSRSFSPRTSLTATKPPRPITSETENAALGDVPAKETLEEILRLMGFPSAVEQKLVGDKVTLLIEAGDDSSILIGKRGKNLNSLQYIVNRICGRQDENTRPVIIDIEDYRQRRRDSLEAMARRLAAKARSSRREVETEPLSASDRRLVHMALKEEGDMVTQSRGEGPFKNVVIKPKSR
jgi:spoIIIJ-associated protein